MKKIFLISVLLILNYQTCIAENILIENHVYVESVPVYYETQTKNIKMMKGLAERQWREQNEKYIKYDYEKLGIEAIQKNKYDEAITILHKGIKYSSVLLHNENKLYYLIGLCYLKKQDYVHAITYFNLAIDKFNLDNAQVYYERGLARYYIKDYEGAKEDFDKSIQKGLNTSANDIINYRDIINKKSRQELYPVKTNTNYIDYFLLYPMDGTAIKLTKIKDLNNIYIDVDDKTRKDKSRAAGLFNQNLSNESIEKYNEIIRLNPSFIEAYNNRAILFLKNKNYDTAIKDLKQALKINPNYKEVIFNLALSYYTDNDYNNAITYIDKYLQLENYSYKKSNPLADFIGVPPFEDEEKFRQYFISQIIKANSLLLSDKLSDSKIIFNQFNTIYPSYYLGNSLLTIKENNYKKADKKLNTCLLFEEENKSYNGMDYKEKSVDYFSNAYVYNNLAIVKSLRNDYVKAFENTRKAKYIAFRNNDISLYKKIIELENIVKSYLTVDEELKTNKEYNKFYNRNENGYKNKKRKEILERG